MENDNKNCNDKKHEFLVEGSELSNFLFESAEVAAQSFIFIVFILVFVFRIFTVQGSSMLSTLQNGNKVVAWQYNYQPTRGDIVVISKYGKLDESIIKRIIALPGDKLYIDFATSSVYVNGKKLNEYYINEPEFGPDVNPAPIPEVVPEGYIFVMGDNRNYSSDSRSTYVGLVPIDKVVGRAFFRYFPFNKISKLESAKYS